MPKTESAFGFVQGIALGAGCAVNEVVQSCLIVALAATAREPGRFDHTKLWLRSGMGVYQVGSCGYHRVSRLLRWAAL